MKLKALFQVFLLVSVFFSMGSFDVSAASDTVCCEQTNAGNYCQQVPSTECAPGSLQAPTSCAQTSFCQPGCCFDKDGDGLCYANYPKSLCEQEFNGRFSNDASCGETLECSRGCCVLGTQTAFTTRVQCQSATEEFPDLEMDFRTDVASEQACLDLSRSSEVGCWVSEDSCSYASRAEDPGNARFVPDQYCSEVAECNCAPGNPALGGSGDERSTFCLEYEDSVYWRDSCGNPEGMKEQCNYLSGSLCGDSDGDGRYACERLDCVGDEFSFAYDDFIGSSEVEGRNEVRNGESWCQYDDELQDDDTEPGGKDPIGSRYYRSLCINGKEFVEPCRDFRQEWCADGTVNVERGGSSVDFTEARCLENRWQECTSSCNTADAFAMDNGKYQEALEKDRECCLDISTKDCSWVGRCVPKVAPGFQYWEGEGTDICSQANTDCPVTFVCNGFNALIGQCEKGSTGAKVTAGVAPFVAGIGAALITGASGGTAALAFGLAYADIFAKQYSEAGWHLVAGEHCLSQDYLQATNNVCRMQGDCGAAMNFLGDYSFTETSKGEELYAGFRNTKNLPSKYMKDFNGASNSKVGDGPGVLENPDWIADESTSDYWATSKRDVGLDGAKVERFFWDNNKQGSWGTQFSTVAGVAGGVVTFAGIFTNVAGIGGAVVGPYGSTINFFKVGVQEGFDTFLDVKLGDGAGATAGASAEGAAKVALEKAGEDGVKKAGEESIRKAAEETFRSSAETAAQKAGTPLNDVARSAIDKGAKSAGDNAVKTATNDQIAEAGREFITDGAKKQFEESAAEIQFGTAIGAAMWVDTIYEIINIAAEEVKTEVVRTECLPWESPQLELSESDKCELCNPNYRGGNFDAYVDADGNALSSSAFKACSEYRCKSLGSQCSLINEGSDEQRCVYLGDRDVNSPVIQPWDSGLSLGYSLTQLPSGESFKRGFKVEYEGSNSCASGEKKLPIYERFVVSLETDEPSQCKMSWDHSLNFEDMGTNYFGGPLYNYFHAQEMFYPASKNRTESLSLSGEGDYTLYIRCQDAQGNANDADYVVEFEVCDAPDIMAPRVVTTSVGDTSFLSAGSNETDVHLFVNEPSSCKFAFSPQDYSVMSGGNCKTLSLDRSSGYYVCPFIGENQVKGFESKAGQQLPVYFKCEDESGNFNAEAYRLLLKGSAPLDISNVEPVSGTTIKTSLSVENVSLSVSTLDGAHLDGRAVCKYTQQESLKDNLPAMIEFAETNSSIHTQLLTPATGQHVFYLGCVDDAGNVAFSETSFSVENDVNAPEIVRTYLDNRGGSGQFVLEVNEDLPEDGCRDSVDDPFFVFESGSVMSKDGTSFKSTHIGSSVYYVQCQDYYGNLMERTTITFA